MTEFEFKTPYSHPLNQLSVKNWIEQSDEKEIAQEFINITTYISYEKFIEVLYKCIDEMIDFMKLNNKKILQFYISDEIETSYIHKSSYWIISHIKKYIKLSSSEFDIIIIDKIDDKDNKDNYIIIADDASYSGSQISEIIENLNGKSLNFYFLIPFISTKALNLFKQSLIENGFNEVINYSSKSSFIMKPIYELMDIENIIKLFKYYTEKGTNINQYPIYFDHKVADNYSSFPLIYSYGVIPNKKNQEIIINAKRNQKALKTVFHKLDRIVLLEKCDDSYDYDVAPQCPVPPYKPNFI
jgi:hypothetical protein